MKAFILAAGIGSRLKPWTEHHPKALVDVCGKPMLQRVIENIVAAGITDIIINVHHFAQQIIEFVETNDLHANITISDESEHLLDTGGGLRKIVPLLNCEPVLIHNADILTDVSLPSLISHHEQSGDSATLLVAQRDSSRRLVFNDAMKLKGWINTSNQEVKPKDLMLDSESQMLCFNGIHIMNSELYDKLIEFEPDDTSFSIIDFYISECSKMPVGGMKMPSEAHWYDVGKPATLQQAIDFLSRLK